MEPSHPNNPLSLTVPKSVRHCTGCAFVPLPLRRFDPTAQRLMDESETKSMSGEFKYISGLHLRWSKLFKIDVHQWLGDWWFQILNRGELGPRRSPFTFDAWQSRVRIHTAVLMSSGFLRRAIRGQFKKSDAGTHDFWDMSGHSLFLDVFGTYCFLVP